MKEVVEERVIEEVVVEKVEVSVATSPGSSYFALADGSSSTGRSSSAGASSTGGRVGGVGVVVIGVVVVVIVLHHLVTVLFTEKVTGDDGVAIAGHQLRLAFGAREALDVVDTRRQRAYHSSSAAYRVAVTLLGAATTAATWCLVVGSGTCRTDPHYQLVGRDPLAASRTRSRTPE